MASKYPKGFVLSENGDLEESPQSKLWRDVLIAAINRGSKTSSAAKFADEAVQSYMKTTEVE